MAEKLFSFRRLLLAVGVACLLIGAGCTTTAPQYTIAPISAEDAEPFRLDRLFYIKSIKVDGILIAASAEVSDEALYETAYLFEHLMSDLAPVVAKNIRDHGVLCVIVGHDEPVSSLPGFETDLTGDDRIRYDWRQRGFLRDMHGHKVALFSEEDVLEYVGGNRLESILIHEFGHVVHKAGFPEEWDKELVALHKRVMDAGLWNDGRAAQRFRRVKSDTPVSLLDALVKAYPHIPSKLLKACVDSGDITVNGVPTKGDQKITKDDKVLIVFGGPKNCYATRNRGEYFAEMYQTWYDTNRTNDHDHNHIHTRDQLREYDVEATAFLEKVTKGSEWRFTSPLTRAGEGHLANYDPDNSPEPMKVPGISGAAFKYWDNYWKDYWPRLADKHGIPIPSGKE